MLSLLPHPHPNRLQCVWFPSLRPCVLTVPLLLISENRQCLVFCTFVSLLRKWLWAPSMSLQRTWSHSFLWLHSIPWYKCTTFSLSSLSLMDIWVDSMSLLLWLVLQWTCVCMYLYNRMIYIPLGIYTVMSLLGQVIFLVLGLWGITILSSTMVELIYIPTNSVKMFLFLHSLTSVCSFSTF